ncbi:kynurenine formamidase [Dongia mobilis]|uniref:Kynurenine formamidase n=1 Tax=Dongia mobilis TaxID=578943 RepID=A0A4R6WYA5_9PROT|nr:arylformamidase [Dongia mobilis]TDQ84423.1 kynurenine formamidase [Dongia mobilis]
MTKIYDISQTLRNGLPVWPGDTAFDLRRTWQMGPGVPVNVSALTLSTHSGSHADAPFHYDAGGATMEAVDPGLYLGPALVVDARGAGRLITADDVLPQLQDGIVRVLLCTYQHAPQENWDAQFKALDASLIDALAGCGIRLIGTDTPSLDPQDSKTMDAHRAVARHRMAILEGLVLDAVPFGIHELIALPLKIAGADSSPVRAILRSL